MSFLPMKSKHCNSDGRSMQTVKRPMQKIHFIRRECPGGVMVKAMNCGIVDSEFVLQSRYYVDFRANTLGRSMNPVILPVVG